MSKGWKVSAWVFGTAAALAMAAQLFFFYRDNFGTHYAIKALSAPLYRMGEIPYWNFADGGGQPLAGNPNTLTFYPDNVLYLFLPAHVAFNLHFLLHLLLGFFAMRALTRSDTAAWLYALSGIAVSATAFYNLVTAIALVPFAFFAAERRSPLILGTAFGLMVLGCEPLTMLAAVLGVAFLAFGRMRVRELALAVGIAFVIASPQLVAYSEIAREVERGVHHYSARTVLNASLPPQRFLELIVGPLHGVLNDRTDERLFSTIFLGMICVPAVLRRSRYTWMAAVLAFFALGRFNPLVNFVIERFESLRLVRFPEKLAIPLVVALVVLVARELPRVQRWWGIAAAVPIAWAAYDLGGWQLMFVSVALAMAAVLLWPARRAMLLLTFVPLIYWSVRALPIDWFTHYTVTPRPVVRVYAPPAVYAPMTAREEYRLRAARLEPLFGATAGLRYGVDRSPDGMFSILTRISAERFTATHEPRYLRIAGCAIPGALPRAFIVPRVAGVHSIDEAVRAIERGAFDEQNTAIAPAKYGGFASPPAARITRFVEHPQSLEIAVASPAPALLFVNETYFRAWVATAGDHHLATLPLDLDRLGVMIPAGNTTVILRFGRHRVAVALAWAVSLLLLIYGLYGGARQIKRAADEDRPLL